MPNERIAAALEAWESRDPKNTRAELARNSGLAASHITALFKGKMSPEPETLAKLLKGLHDERAFTEVLRAALEDRVPDDLLECVNIIVRSLKEGAPEEPRPSGDEFDDNIRWLAEQKLRDRQIVRWINSTVSLLRRTAARSAAMLTSGLMTSEETNPPPVTEEQTRRPYPKGRKQHSKGE